jgi:hypothetical protein
MSERSTAPWQTAAGLHLIGQWATYAREPYANDLLVALMREFTDCTFVVAFDGFFYNAADVEDGDQLCTLSLFVRARREDDCAQDYVRFAKEHAYPFMRAWIAGWRAARGDRS